ncbi:MAG: hypothetical protein SVR94_08895 [Pseudomonadota bacterium]|nr:hypothetical protein [Pseudomonadota bacterium]
MEITQKQMDAFSQEEWEKLAIRIADFLQDQFDNARQTSREQLLPVIHEQVIKARAYGLVTEQQIATYVTTAWLLGRQFDKTSPAAQQVLSASAYTPEEKSEWLTEWTEQIFATLNAEEN